MNLAAIDTTPIQDVGEHLSAGMKQKLRRQMVAALKNLRRVEELL